MQPPREKPSRVKQTDKRPAVIENVEHVVQTPTGEKTITLTVRTNYDEAVT